jgi:multicomponent K+:H+ antiporter subunit E
VSIREKVAPAPLLSAVLLAVWLMLSRSASLGHVLFGLALALVVPIFTFQLRRSTTRVRKPLLVLRYASVVMYDVLRSNLEVAIGVLRWRRHPPPSKFVIVPLELGDPAGLATLAVVTTIVPGTVWSELALDRSRLLLHVWDVGEESTFVQRYKDRYERPLREIFE